MKREEIQKKDLAADCIIWTYFLDTKDPKIPQLRYCEENCHYRCLKGKDYKKRGKL